jgi:Aromatic-ring-opening dioxygenase LigAB, LigA subunit
VSVYAVHKLLRRISLEPDYREQVKRDPEAALGEIELTPAERSALLQGKVQALNGMGVHGYLLARLARYELFGLDQKLYVERIRQR